MWLTHKSFSIFLNGYDNNMLILYFLFHLFHREGLFLLFLEIFEIWNFLFEFFLG